MYCPKCGQQQISGEMRFCSRCGFQLGVVSALVATGGVPPAVIVGEVKSKSELAVRRRKRQGAKLMFASGVLMPIAMGLSILTDSPFPFIFPFTIFLIGLAWMLYFRLFGEEVKSNDHHSSAIQLGEASQVLLPSPQTQFAPDTNWHGHRTAEIVHSPSVTENTTRLLDSEEGKP